MAKLAQYRAKRDFSKTQEPTGGRANSRGMSFVVQKHDATRLHYDFRLELDGVLKSWAVAKGPSLIPGEKRLAIHVEDHPLEYGTFEGTIPKGQYGGGTVMLWDRGTWEVQGDPHKTYAKGHLTFRLDGQKSKGLWHLVRMKKKPGDRQEPWLLIKSDDEFARGHEDRDLLDELPFSAKTGRSLEAIATSRGPSWDSKRSSKPSFSQTSSSSTKSAVKKEKGTSTSRRSKTLKSTMPPSIKPSLATLTDKVPQTESWLHEIKWDGYRIIAFLDKGRVVLKTRNDLDWTHRFPNIAMAIADLDVENAILDGEAVVEDKNGLSSFSALQTALSNDNRQSADEAIYYAFDILYLNGQDLRDFPLKKRKATLLEIMPKDRRPESLRYSDHIEANGNAMVQNACRLGLEGVVSKRVDQPYRSGRNKDWLKFKCTQRDEFVIAGFTPSTSLRTAVGSLILGYYDGDRLVHVGRSGTGFTADLARDIYKKLVKLRIDRPAFAQKLTTLEKRGGAIWVRPELVAEIEFRGWTDDNAVRHAAFKGLREDKNPREVFREKDGRPPEGRTIKRNRTIPHDDGTTVAGVSLTHPDRILWDGQGITKQGLAEFYIDIAEWILPHIVNRPLALVRCPSGSQRECFFQKHAWAGLTDYIIRGVVRDKEDEEEVLLVRDIKGLVALVQAGVLEIHPWGATIDDIDRPDRITFDFDPGGNVTWDDVIVAAREMQNRLKALKLESFVKTTGGKGLHVVVPLTPRAGWGQVKKFAKTMAEAMEADHPNRYLAKAAKREREGKIYIDYLRNGRGATAIAAYSTRARAGAPVSTPLAWDELSLEIKSNHFTVENLMTRLDSLKKDPWVQISKIKQTLPSLARIKR